MIASDVVKTQRCSTFQQQYPFACLGKDTCDDSSAAPVPTMIAS
jgi:hypothetical protein